MTGRQNIRWAKVVGYSLLINIHNIVLVGGIRYFLQLEEHLTINYTVQYWTSTKTGTGLLEKFPPRLLTICEI